MAASRVSTNPSSVLSVCHLVFSIFALAILSYKVYYLEKEMSFIRKEMFTVKGRGDPSAIQKTPLSTAPINSEQLTVIERNRRSQKTSEARSVDKLQEKCLQTILSNIQVCLYFL